MSEANEPKESTTFDSFFQKLDFYNTSVLLGVIIWAADNIQVRKTVSLKERE
jgi:hypothetical protein